MHIIKSVFFFSCLINSHFFSLDSMDLLAVEFIAFQKACDDKKLKEAFLIYERITAAYLWILNSSERAAINQQMTDLNNKVLIHKDFQDYMHAIDPQEKIELLNQSRDMIEHSMKSPNQKKKRCLIL